MGLAEPRKRTKLAHDPRNLAWSNASNTYGQRLMQSQGWKSGDALGAQGGDKRYSDTDAAKVVVQYKVDTLGLGASLKSKDIAHQRTGFDAFQGLLGRLNAKTEDEIQAVEKKVEDRKLAMFAQGRWGGMVFVPGGLLVQTDPFKQKLESRKPTATITYGREGRDITSEADEASIQSDSDTKSRQKAERKQRREEKRMRKEEKRREKAEAISQVQDQASLPTPESSSSNEDAQQTCEAKGKKRVRSSEQEPPSAQQTKLQMRNGRHILRGKNILAKRAAFADMKGLDEIFMRVS